MASASQKSIADAKGRFLKGDGKFAAACSTTCVMSDRAAQAKRADLNRGGAEGLTIVTAPAAAVAAADKAAAKSAKAAKGTSKSAAKGKSRKKVAAGV